jgi:hypothetical protein
MDGDVRMQALTRLADGPAQRCVFATVMAPGSGELDVAYFETKMVSTVVQLRESSRAAYQITELVRYVAHRLRGESQEIIYS